MKNYIARIFEETLPLIVFLINERNILKSVNTSSEVIDKSKPYSVLDEGCLNKRIEEEHERSVKIDDKTSKFTLGLSVSLTVLAAASGAFAKFIPENSYTVYISIACGIASIYMLLAGITALGALKTLATYGYGTQHLLNKKSDGVSYLSKALYSQEKMNVVRQLRNEAAYQSLRNGFIVLLIALIISVFSLLSQSANPLTENKMSVLPKIADENKTMDKSRVTDSLKIEKQSTQPIPNVSEK